MRKKSFFAFVLMPFADISMIFIRSVSRKLRRGVESEQSGSTTNYSVKA